MSVSDNQSRPGRISPFLERPVKNAVIESFNGKVRDECLNASGAETLREARDQFDNWRTDYDETRPQNSLGGLPPAQYVPDWTERISPLGAMPGGLMDQELRAVQRAAGLHSDWTSSKGHVMRSARWQERLGPAC